MLVLPSAAREVGLATNVDVLLEGAEGTKVTVAVSFTVPKVAVIVFTWAVVDAKVAVNTPALLVLPDTGVNALLLPLLAKDTL